MRMRYEDYLKQQAALKKETVSARSIGRTFRGRINAAAHAAARLSRVKKVPAARLVRAAARAVAYRLDAPAPKWRV